MATQSLRKAYAMLQGSLRAGCFKLCAYANRLRSQVQELGRVFKKTYANCLRKSSYKEDSRAYAGSLRKSYADAYISQFCLRDF